MGYTADSLSGTHRALKTGWQAATTLFITGSYIIGPAGPSWQHARKGLMVKWNAVAFCPLGQEELNLPLSSLGQNRGHTSTCTR